MLLGFWVLIGIISFVICEKLVTFAKTGEENAEEKTDISSNNNLEKLLVSEKFSNQEEEDSSHRYVCFLYLCI